MVKRLYNKRVAIKRRAILARNLLLYLTREFETKINANEKLLRWAITGTTEKELFVEMVIAEMQSPIERSELTFSSRLNNKTAVVHIVPTGVRASIGGYIGDATPATNLLGQTADYVIANPNTVNAAMVNYAMPNVLYVEGYALDQFFSQHVLLEPISGSNCIGLLIDKIAARDDNMLNLIFAAADTCRIAGGMDIRTYVLTDDVVGGASFQTKSGTFSGKIKNPSSLISAAEKLFANNHPIDVIAITTHIQIPGNALKLYHQGKIPDPHGGLEAIISHFLSWQTRKMVAHAPLLFRKEIEKMLFGMKTVDPRAAGEIVSAAGFLGCVFKGLSRAPRLLWSDGEYIATNETMLGLNNVIAIVAPYNALGGLPMLVAAEKNIPVIAVKENETLLNVTKHTLRYGGNVIEVDDYYQAAALIRSLPFRHGEIKLSKSELENLTTEGGSMAKEAGINFSALRRPVYPFKKMGMN